MTKWNIEESRELYNIRGWGLGYFDINNKGHIVVQPQVRTQIQLHLNLLNTMEKQSGPLSMKV